LVATDTPVLCVCHQGGVVFAIHRRKVDVCDAQTGDRLHTALVPEGTRWVHARFFRGPRCWLALAFDGKATHFEEVINDRNCKDMHHLVTMFDVEAVQGPVAISGADGSLFFTADLKRVALPVPLNGWVKVEQIARSGRTLCVEHSTSKSYFPRERVIVDVWNRSVRTMRGDVNEAVEPSYRQVIRGHNLRNHFLTVGATGSRLVLESRRRRFVWVDLENPDRLVLKPAADDATVYWESREFVPAPGPPGAKYRLQVATFPDGSKVFLDSRGLLHLKSSDRAIPEATIVLFDQSLAVWCSNGKTCGSKFFLGMQERATAEEIWETVLKPFAARLT
jgi:hypothetical protein